MEPGRTMLSLASILVLAACSGGDGDSFIEGETPTSSEAAAEQPAPIEPPALVAKMLEPFHGDFEAMVEKREIRALVTWSRTNFFLDGGTQRGITADALREFEKELNKELKLRRRPLHISVIPILHDQLIPFLEEGRGDIAIASLSITPDRAQRVPFSTPTAEGISELVVTGPQSPVVADIDDLSGERVVVRSSSSYVESLEAINASFRDRGMDEIDIAQANEYLETEDLLEMVNAGLIGITIADGYLARFWSQFLPDVVVHDELAVATGRTFGWALRPDATGLKEHVDRFVKANRQGRLLGNTLINRYLKDTKWVENALSPDNRQRLEEVIELFRKYADQFDFDYRMVAALGYQESKFNQDLVSRAGAVGIMQLLPSTAADKAVGIPDITTAENNIHAGVKYLRFIVDHYFDDPAIDEVNKTLFAFASYNAGPNRIRRLRAKAAEQGFDPNVWFRNVEVVVSNEVGRQPVEYVRNIFKYYTAYSLLSEQNRAKQQVIAEAQAES